jgi:hypothetical protein
MQIATSKNLTVLGALTILGACVAAAVTLLDGDPATAPNWEALGAAMTAGIGMILAKGASNTGGTVASTPEAQARVAPKGFARLLTMVAVAAVLSGLLFAAPARATPGVVCLSGCGGNSPPHTFGALPDTQVSSTVWAGPGIGVLPFVYSGQDKRWTQVAAPAFSYGIWWRPPGWTATTSLVGVNLSLTADFSNLSHVDPIMTVVLLDYITVGGGIRARFGTDSQAGGISPLFALGFTTSFGGP